MFDGIDIVTLPAADITPLLDLYEKRYGFTVMGDHPVTDPGWRRVWGLPAPPRRAVLLGKPRSAGGWIRLVEVPGLPPARLRARPDRVGPLALDFYLRDPDAVEAAIAAAGWGFRSEAVHYPLPGTDVQVRERMLEQPVSGLLHAMVGYRPGQTRCVLGVDAEARASEVVACVFVTDRFAEAKRFAEEVLGARRYFEGRFDHPAVARMLGLAPGEGFAAALFRGPASRNARLEFAQAMPPQEGTPPPDPVPRVIAGCAMDDLPALERALAGGAHGRSTGILTLRDGDRTVRRIGLVSRYGAAFEFWQREPA